jgi:hypothetical protein
MQFEVVCKVRVVKMFFDMTSFEIQIQIKLLQGFKQGRLLDKTLFVHDLGQLESVRLLGQFDEQVIVGDWCVLAFVLPERLQFDRIMVDIRIRRMLLAFDLSEPFESIELLVALIECTLVTAQSQVVYAFVFLEQRFAYGRIELDHIVARILGKQDLFDVPDCIVDT